jgi:hypothetical protein
VGDGEGKNSHNLNRNHLVLWYDKRKFTIKGNAFPKMIAPNAPLQTKRAENVCDSFVSGVFNNNKRRNGADGEGV